MNVPNQPPFFTRGLPGPGHEILKVLEGKWRAEVTLYVEIGSTEHPVSSSDFVTTRTWIGDGRFLQDLTTGSIGGMPYWRLGILGFDNMACRYEWVTVDGIGANMMMYQGAPGSGPRYPINMTGSFVDQGVLGEAYVGKVIGDRTEIILDGPDKHTFNIYLTPSGAPERIADRNVYTRIT